jgi:hypothetical protein
MRVIDILLLKIGRRLKREIRNKREQVGSERREAGGCERIICTDIGAIIAASDAHVIASRRAFPGMLRDNAVLRVRHRCPSNRHSVSNENWT